MSVSVSVPLRRLPWFAPLAFLTGCAGLLPPALAQQMAVADAQAQSDAQLSHQLDLAKDRATLPGASFADVEAWAATLEAVWDAGVVVRGGADGEGHAEALFERLGPWEENPETKARALAWRGRVHLRQYLFEDAQRALHASLDEAPSTLAALPLVDHLGQVGNVDGVPAVCQKARPGMKTDDERLLLLDRCVKAQGPHRRDTALSWASAEDRALYDAQLISAAERQAAREEAQQARAEQAQSEARARDEARRAAAPTKAAPKAQSAPAPHTGRVEIVSECRRSVRLFFGDTPKFGSGRYTTWGGNTRGQEHVGKRVWLVDERDNGLSSASVGPGTRQVVILSNCTGLSTR